MVVWLRTGPALQRFQDHFLLRQMLQYVCLFDLPYQIGNLAEQCLFAR